MKKITEEEHSILLPFSYGSHYKISHMPQKGRITIHQFHCVSVINLMFFLQEIPLDFYVMQKYMDSIKPKRNHSTPLKRTYLRKKHRVIPNTFLQLNFPLQHSFL